MLRVSDEWLLTPYRVAVHEPTATAVIADLHLGDAVPLPDPRAALAPLRHAHDAVAFRRLVVAGDLFEKEFVPALYAAFVETLERLTICWLGLVPGNHDRRATRGANPIPVLPD